MRAAGLERRLFKVGVYVGFECVGQVDFYLNHRKIRGRVVFQTDDPELTTHLLAVPTKCSWPVFVESLTRGITLKTAGRYTFRFTQTPSLEGRGRDKRLRRCMDRV